MASDNVILITGAAKGIGAELARGFLHKGWRIVVNFFRSETAARRLLDELASVAGPGRAMSIKADVSKRVEVRKMFAMVHSEFGRVDALVNNAGLNDDAPIAKLSDFQWERVLAVNLTGTFLCSQEFAIRFRGKRGHIVNIGATTAFLGRKNGANFCSAKAGVIALSKCLALELAPRILVNCIIPGWIATKEVVTRFGLDNHEKYDEVINTIPLRRMGKPQDVLVLVDFLVNHSEYITGQNFFVNGGFYLP